jgi:hypothetical protein
MGLSNDLIDLQLRTTRIDIGLIVSALRFTMCDRRLDVGSRLPDAAPWIADPPPPNPGSLMPELMSLTELTSSSASIFENAISQNVCIMFA